MELKITDFEIFKMIEQEKIRNKKNYSAIYESNAAKKNIYGGRRFLGFTPKGKDVWVTMKYTRDDMELFLKVDKLQAGTQKLYQNSKSRTLEILWYLKYLEKLL